MLPAVQAAAPSTPAPAVVRNVSLDAYRGLVMLLMMAEVLHLASAARAYPGNWFWSVLAWNQTHVEWAGCSLHDLIQPSFSFLVGAALPYSIASRLARGASFGELFGHALWRSLVLIALGIFLRSTHSRQTNFTFEDTLTQIGLGYPFLFALGYFARRERVLWIALAVILFGYWLAWALYPVPQPEFGAHWYKNSNLGAAFDRWFLNLFPRPAPFVENRGGYLTLNFIPTLGTMILGLAAGRWVRAAAPRLPMRRLLVAGAAGIAAGLVLHFAGVVPVVKRIWTPSWTLFSGGACFLLLAGFAWLLDVKGYRRWALPLVVIGMNSIAAYLIAHLLEEFLEQSFAIHLGADFFAFLGPGLEPLLRGLAILAVYYAILHWMHQRRIFLRI